MNHIEFLQRGIDVIFLRALGHFLWEAAALGLAASLSLRLLRNNSASIRCAILTLCLLGLPISAGVTVLVVIRSTRPAPTAGTRPVDSELVKHETPRPVDAVQEHTDIAAGVHRLSSESVEASQAMTPFPVTAIVNTAPQQSNAPAATPSPRRWALAIAIVYLTGVFLMLLRLCLGVRGSVALRGGSWPVTEEGLLAAYTRQLRCNHIRKKPELLFCKHVLAPAVVGILKPVILLPIAICSELRMDQIELLLAHELAHIRRHDQILDLIQRIIEAFFFFHPAVWYISLAIRTEREKCCDDIVVRQGHNPLDYAGVLVRVAELSSAVISSPMALAQSAAGRRSQLRHRILRLIGPVAPSDIFPSRAAAVTILIVVLIGAYAGIRLLGAHPAKAAPATQSSPYHIVFDNGASVDVLTVSVVPSRHKPFWTPDGEQVINPPYTSLDGGYGRGDAKKATYEITIRINGTDEDSPWIRSRAAANINIANGVRPYEAAGGSTDLRVFTCALPAKTNQIDFELGIAANRWQLVRAFNGVGVYGEGPGQISVVEPNEWEKRDEPGSQFSVSLPPMDGVVLRLVAVDKTGGRHVSTGHQSSGGEHDPLIAVFGELPPDSVKEYRVEKCAYEWKPITGIHLKPNGDWNTLVSQDRINRLTSAEQKFKLATDGARIDGDIEKIEHLKPFDDTSDAWVAAIRDLSEIGAPAVPAIVTELRQTGQRYERSGLAIALRAIDDPRSIPGVIDALADCPFGISDYGGLRTKDPALTHFMLSIQDTNRQYDPKVLGFEFGRPVTEIKRTLDALADHDASPAPIMDDKRQLYEDAASRWSDWWDKNEPFLTDGLSALRVTGDSAKQPLQLAIADGQMAEVKKLVEGGADVNLAGTDGWTPLHLAAALERLDTIQFLLDHKANPDLRTDDGCTSLLAALGLGIAPVYTPLPNPSIDIVRLLLDHHADARAVNSRGQGALQGAAAFDDPELIQLLLDRGALINARDNRGRTALHRAVQCDRAEVVDQLLKAGADVNAKDLTGRTPFAMGAFSRYYPQFNSPLVHTLLDHGAEVPLKTAIALGSVKDVAAALKKNPPLNEKMTDSEDRSALDWAIFGKSPEEVQMLLDAGADPNGHEADGNMPLHAAMFVGNTQIVSMLIAAKADVNGLGQGDEPPIFWACLDLRADIVDLLLNAGAKPGVCGIKDKSTPISLALQGTTDPNASGSVGKKTDLAKQIITSLLAHGADINEPAGRSGFRPIFGAGGEIADFLFAHGARLDVVDDEGNSPLHYAAVLSKVEAVKFLLQHHVPLETRNKKGETALARCVGFYPQNGVVELLLDAGASVSARDNKGMTPLHAAVTQGSSESVIALLDKGADVNAKDNAGLTPLHLAAKLGRDELIQLLLKHGADVNSVDAGGRTPVQWATKVTTIALLRGRTNK